MKNCKKKIQIKSEEKKITKNQEWKKQVDEGTAVESGKKQSNKDYWIENVRVSHCLYIIYVVCVSQG